MSFVDTFYTATGTGLGIAIGGAIVEIWIKPYMQKIHSHTRKKLGRKKK